MWLGVQIVEARVPHQFDEAYRMRYTEPVPFPVIICHFSFVIAAADRSPMTNEK